MDAGFALKSKNKMLPNLREDEKVLSKTVISDWIYLKSGLILLLAIILLLFAWQLTLFMCLVAVLSFVFTTIKKTYLLLVVTDQRVLVKSGILLTDMIQLQYSKIESVETQTTLLGRFLGYSTLMVSGTGSRMAYIPYVENALSLQNAMNEILQERDVSSREHMQLQARVQAEAMADVLEEHKEL